jgi:hypothetical protein
MGLGIDASDLTPYFSKFSLLYCGMFISAALFPLLIMKQINFLIKLNSYGVYFVSVLLIFVIYTGISSIFNTSYDFEYKPNVTGETTRHIYLFGENPSLLAGSLMLGYFSHSFVLPMMKNNQNQKNNRRDLFYGYALVFITYVGVGILGYIGFSGSEYDGEFKDVILLN